MRQTGRSRRLRERPPPWPRRDDGADEPSRQRWDREREPFEDGALPELYPGSLVMEDLVAAGDEKAAVRVLARYTVIRLLLLSAGGVIEGTPLRVERRVALEHLTLLPREDWERRTLDRLARLCSDTPAPPLIVAILNAAETAAKRGQPMGAFALYRAAYEIALRCAAGDVASAATWWRAASAAARGIARLAQLEEARRSERLWGKRAYVLRRRAERAEAAASSDDTGPPPPEPPPPASPPPPPSQPRGPAGPTVPPGSPE